MPGSTGPRCPSVNGAWPTEGCFEYAGRLYDSSCAVDGAGNAGNTFDSMIERWANDPHNGICFSCVDDPNAPAVEEAPVGDDAAAVGDPHITTNTGEHFDVSLLEETDTSEQAPNCPAGKMASFFKTTGPAAMCSDSGGFRVKDSATCAAGVLGMPGSTGPRCPSVNGAWPTEGCFEYAGRLYDSSCAVDGAGNAGNTFDSMIARWANDPHNGICYNCVDDPNAPVVEEGDDAAAAGDPHITTNSGMHFDIDLLEQAP